MNQDEILIQNRNQVDSAIQVLLLNTREIVCELVKPLAAQGSFSLENIPADSRGNLRTVDDIARTMDPTALLAVLMECLSDRSSSGLEIPGVNFQLVDKVRRIRNDHAHGEGDFGDFNYVRDAVNATNDLRFGLLSAEPRLRGSRSGTPSEEESSIRQEQYRTELLFQQFNVGNVNTMLRLIEEGVNTEVTNAQGDTSLHLAISRGFPQVANALVLSGSPLEAKNEVASTPLHLASRGRSVEIVRELISAGADILAEDNDGNTPLHLVASRGRQEAVEILIGAGGKVDGRNSQGETPLHLVAARGHTSLIDILIHAGADLNAQNSSGNTPLHLAILNKSNLMREALLQAGADVSVSNNAGRTPLQLADDIRLATKRKWVITSVLAGLAAIAAAVLVLITLGGAMVEQAVRNNEIWKVKALAAVGVDVNIPKDDDFRFTPLHMAASAGLTEMAATLIEVGADIEAEDRKTYKPLHLAARHDQSETARALISAGAEVNSITFFDATPLHEAALKGSVLTSKELIAAGADINARIEDGYTPLHAAAMNQQVGTGKLLIEAGADYNSGGVRSGKTPLHIAAANGDLSFARMLADSGADVNTGDVRGWRPLHYAILRPLMGIGYFPGERNEESGAGMVELLVSLGADVGARTNTGNAPLHMAAGEGDIEIVNALIRAGADVNDRNDEGRTALFFAEEANHAAAAAMILESGGTR